MHGAETPTAQLDDPSAVHQAIGTSHSTVRFYWTFVQIIQALILIILITTLLVTITTTIMVLKGFAKMKLSHFNEMTQFRSN